MLFRSATLVAGAGASNISCRLTTFPKAPGDRIGDSVLDANDSFAMHLRLQNGAVGVIHASRMASGHFNNLFLRIFGTKGGLDLRYENDVSSLRASIGDDMLTPVWRDVAVPPVASNYQRFIAAIRGGAQVLPDFARGAELQKVLDLAVASNAKNSQDLPVH